MQCVCGAGAVCFRETAYSVAKIVIKNGITGKGCEKTLFVFSVVHSNMPSRPTNITKKQQRLAGAAAIYLKAVELFNSNLLSLSYTVAVNDSNNVDTLNRSSGLGTTCCVVLNAYYLATLGNEVVNRSLVFSYAYQTPT